MDAIIDKTDVSNAERFSQGGVVPFIREEERVELDRAVAGYHRGLIRAIEIVGRRSGLHRLGNVISD
jgi:hypothetical protein